MPLMPTLYMKNKMAEASLLPQRKRKKVILGHSRVFLLDFYLFQDLHTHTGIVSRISLKKNWTLKLSQKASELNNLFIYLNSFFNFLLGMYVIS